MKERKKDAQIAHEHTARIAKRTRRLCLAAFLVALSFLLGLLAKTLQGTSPLRLTVEGLPILFAGITLGPLWGAAVGVMADLLSCLMAGQTPLPLITVGAAALGLLAGLFARLLFRKDALLSGPPSYPALLLLTAAAHTVGSILIKSYALSAFYGFDTLIFRAPIYLGIILLESYLLYLLLRSHPIRRELERLLKP